MPLRTDSASRVIAASPSTIYQAFTDPNAWAIWLPPSGMTARIDEFDFRPGGAYKIALIYNTNQQGKTSANTDVVRGQFLELTPNRRMVQRVAFDSTDPACAGEMTMTWSLAPQYGGTAVTITCENVPAGIAKEDHDTGLRSTLENLANFTQQSAPPTPQ